MVSAATQLGSTYSPVSEQEAADATPRAAARWASRDRPPAVGRRTPIRSTRPLLAAWGAGVFVTPSAFVSQCGILSPSPPAPACYPPGTPYPARGLALRRCDASCPGPRRRPADERRRGPHRRHPRPAPRGVPAVWPRPPARFAPVAPTRYIQLHRQTLPKWIRIKFS